MATTPPRRRSSTPSPSSARNTILVVDDSATTRNVMSVYLMGGEFNLVTAEDGERALRLVRLMKVDLVIADVNMPNMDGLTFVQTLRRGTLPSMAKIRVILITGDQDPQLEARAQALGVDAFLRKPLDASTLVTLVRRLLPENEA